MKKLFASMALASLAGVSAAAQNPVFNNPDNKAYFGLRAGLDISIPGDVKAGSVSLDVFNPGTGVEIGGIYNIPLVANLYLEPGLKFYYNTYSAKAEILDAIQDHNVIRGLQVRKFGMRIPVAIGYHFDFTKDFKLYLSYGPELEIGFSAKEHLKTSMDDFSESMYGDDGLKRVDVLLATSLGISYKNLYSSFSESMGVLNMLPDSHETFNENRVTISVGYNF